MEKKYLLGALTLGFLATVGCGGSGSSTSNNRNITGNVGSSSAAALTTSSQTTASDCLADTILATDTSGTTTSATVADDCSFTLPLSVGQTYSISFVLNSEFVGNLLFDAGITGFTSNSLPISSGSGNIELGVISFSGHIGRCSHEPYEQMDSDDDGVDNLTDTDDDNDGITDDSEEDCDLNGVIDDNDHHSDCSSDENETTPRVIEVKPRNDPQPEHGRDTVNLDKEVRARISCVVNQETVTSDTFTVTSSTGDAVVCSYSFEDVGEKDIIICSHETAFATDTVYTAAIDGVLCEDGTAVTARSWSWLTDSESSEDDSHIDLEDSIDNRGHGHSGSDD